MWSASLRLTTLVAGLAVVSAPPRRATTLIGDASGNEGDIFAFSVFVDEPGNAPLTLSWDFGDGSPAVSGPEETSVAHRYMDEGSFTVSVTVLGGETQVSTGMTVQVAGVAPVITVMSDEAAGQTVRMQAEAVDPGDDELTYRWDFGDGSPPQEGVDLREVSHTYTGAQAYTTTLTVIDDDGLETSRVLGVEANPGFVGEIRGEVPRMPFAGSSGKIALVAALPGAGPFSHLPMFQGVAVGGGIADLSNAGGICMVSAGFWDDEHKAHVNFQWTPDAARMFEPRMYMVGWDEENGAIAKDQVLVNALVLPIEDTYEKTKNTPDPSTGASGGGVAGLLGTTLSDLAAAFDEDAPQVGPGRNWTLTSFAGFIKTTKVTYRRIEGRIDVRLKGAWVESGGSGTATYAELVGDFSWELDAVAQANILRCAKRDFGLETHTPWIEEDNVDFRAPDISLSLTLPYDRASVTTESFAVGWLDDTNGFNPIEGEFIHDDDEVTIHFVPKEELDGAVFYKARVRGGDTGIKGLAGDLLPQDYEWRFSTFPDFVPVEPGTGTGTGTGPGGGTEAGPGDGGAEDRGAVSEVERPLRGATLEDRASGPFAGPMVGPPLPPRQVPIQAICDRVPQSEWDTKPTVDILVYQTSCNKRLVPGKPAVARIYLNWDYPEGKKGIDKYSATVTMTSSAGAVTETATMKRQALYSDRDRRDARNSINIPFRPSGGQERIGVEVKATPVGPESPTPLVAKQSRILGTLSERIAFGVPVIFPMVGSWNSGVPQSVIDRWTSGVDIAADGATFATENLPVARIQAQVNKKPFALPDEPTSRRTVDCGPGNSRECMNYREYAVLDLDAGDWLQAALNRHYSQGGAKRPHVVLAVVPEDYGSAWGGVTKHHVGLGSAWSDVRPRTPSVIFIKADMNTRTVAHELGHYMGLPHKDERGDAERDPGIEGFRIGRAGMSNKSYAEGNGRSNQLMSLMEAGDTDQVEDNNWILNDQYEALVEDLNVNPLWSQTAWNGSTAGPGGWPLGAPLGAPASIAPPAPLDALRGHFSGDRRGEERPRGPWAESSLGVGSSIGSSARAPYLLVSGWMPPASEDAGHLYPVEVADLTPADAAALSASGPYTLRLLGSDGAALAEASFQPETEYWSEGEVHESTLYPFMVAVPAVGGVASVTVADASGKVMAERSAGASAPDVRFLSAGGRVWEAGGSVRWEGSDPDGDAVTYSLAYRPDEASDWVSLVTGTTETEFEPDPDWLVPGTAPRMRLTASDGVNATAVESTDVAPSVRVVGRWPSASRSAGTDAAISVSFNAPLAGIPGPDALTVVGAGGPVEGAVVQEAPDLISFVPAAPLSANTEYQVRVGPGLRSVTGGSMPSDRWTFTTEPDTEAPRVDRMLPREGGLSIPLQPVVYIWFTEVMDSASVASAVQVRRADGSAVAGDYRYFPNAGVFVATFPEPLEASTTYQVGVGSGAHDLAGNALDPTAGETTSTFTTVGTGGPNRPPARRGSGGAGR